ncbi:MAG: LCP family protein [Acidimicrobiales bacterium]
MSTPRHARARPARSGRTWPQRVCVVVGALLSLSFATAASGVGYIYWRLGDITVFEEVTVDEVDEPGEPRNYLIVGSDERSPTDGDFDETPGERADTIMVARFDPGTKHAELLSLPRDLWVELPDGGHDRINAAYGAGRQNLIETIKANFGIEVHHYIEVDFVAFRQLVESIGGVSMYFDVQMRDDNSGLNVAEPGCVVLSGEQALAFARARNLEYRGEGERWRTDPTGDLGRITRQQIFVRRVVEQALAENLLNPVTLNSLLGVALDNVGFDPVLGRRDALLDLADLVDGFELENLRSYSVPASDWRTRAGAAVLRIDEAAARPVFNVFRGLDPNSFRPGDVTVTVLNGSGVSGEAGQVRDALDIVGFMTAEPSTADEGFAQTTIFYNPEWASAADLLARHLTSGAVLQPDPSLAPGELTLVTGTDFTTVMDQPRAESSAAATTTTAPPDETTSTDVPTETPPAAPGATSTTAPGIAPGDPPPGVTCA